MHQAATPRTAQQLKPTGKMIQGREMYLPVEEAEIPYIHSCGKLISVMGKVR